eukprot:1159855-Pelagomonas_calceolata.AAC.3
MQSGMKAALRVLSSNKEKHNCRGLQSTKRSEHEQFQFSSVQSLRAKMTLVTGFRQCWRNNDEEYNKRGRVSWSGCRGKTSKGQQAGYITTHLVYPFTVMCFILSCVPSCNLRLCSCADGAGSAAAQCVCGGSVGSKAVQIRQAAVGGVRADFARNVAGGEEGHSAPCTVIITKTNLGSFWY